MIDRSTPAGRFVLLAVAAFVALAPLCSAVIAAPQESGTAALHGDHAMRSAQHDAPVATFTSAALSGPRHGSHCTPHSCCAAALVKNVRLGHTDGTAVPPAVTATVAESQRGCRLASAAGPVSAPEAAGTHAPLRL